MKRVLGAPLVMLQRAYCTESIVLSRRHAPSEARNFGINPCSQTPETSLRPDETVMASSGRTVTRNTENNSHRMRQNFCEDDLETIANLRLVMDTTSVTVHQNTVGLQRVRYSGEHQTCPIRHCFNGSVHPCHYHQEHQHRLLCIVERATNPIGESSPTRRVL